MNLPFTVAQFYEIFSVYNQSVWPAQIVLLGLAIVAALSVVIKRPWSGVAVSAILALLWTWLGLAYHFAFFTQINPMAYAFGAISLIGGLIFFWQGVVRRKLQFAVSRGWRSAAGFALIAFALVVYPVWSVLAGHAYPAMPTFGLPCPTTIFTIGMLALLGPTSGRAVYIVPLLWSFVGGQAAFLLGVPQDLGLIVAGLICAVLMWRRDMPSGAIAAR